MNNLLRFARADQRKTGQLRARRAPSPIAQQGLLPRGNFSTVGTSQSTKRYIGSITRPVRGAPDALSADDAVSAAA